MSRLFRGKLLAGLRKLGEAGNLLLRGTLAPLLEAASFDALLDALYRTDFVVYAKPPFGGAENVYAYLGRYTHRVGLSNRRLRSIDDRGVCFATKHGKTITLAPVEFIRRFLLHVLPGGFVKLRHYGLLASSNVHSRLERARTLLGASRENNVPPPPSDDVSWRDRFFQLTCIDLRLCPDCRTPTMIVRPLSGMPAPPPLEPPVFADSS